MRHPPSGGPSEPEPGVAVLALRQAWLLHCHLNLNRCKGVWKRAAWILDRRAKALCCALHQVFSGFRPPELGALIVVCAPSIIRDSMNVRLINKQSRRRITPIPLGSKSGRRLFRSHPLGVISKSLSGWMEKSHPDTRGRSMFVQLSLPSKFLPSWVVRTLMDWLLTTKLMLQFPPNDQVNWFEQLRE
uniref:Uncharacterized protein n=1 Tax=Physcomitrium patens TaxID=3218 RepID=A9S7L2_PHYPA|nr:hypothetical protein PHYPA_030784 [Physcomitrium patens]